MSNQAPPGPPPGPTMAPGPAPAPAPLTQVSCPRCFTLVAAGTQFCPNCGNALPPSYPSIPQPVAVPPRQPRTRLIIAIILLVIIVGGVGGYAFYTRYLNNSQSPIAKTAEQVEANQAPNQIQFTCLSVATDVSHLIRDYYGHILSGYATISETFGLKNPTRFPIAATWTITLDYTSLNLVLPATASFNLAAAGGTARPVFPFTITSSQYNSFPSNPDFTKFTVTLAASFTVTGTYATYSVSQHATYDSTTHTGTGSLGSSGSLTPCP